MKHVMFDNVMFEACKVFDCSQEHYYPNSPSYLMSQHSIKFFFCNRKSLSINAVNNKNDELGEKPTVQYVSTKYKLQKACFQVVSTTSLPT